MPPNPLPNNTPVAALTTGIVTEDLNVTLNNNVSIKNNHSSGFDIKSLPINTKSVVNAGALNITTIAGVAKLKVDYDGNMISSGYITTTGAITTVAAVNSTSLFVYQNDPTDATSTFSVSSAGKITASDDLSIASKFKVTALTGDINSGAITSGAITVSGGITTTANININGGKIVLGNDGAITALGDLSIDGTSETKFKVTASSGDISTKGSITAAGNFTITDGTTDWFKIDSTNGNTTIKGTTSGTGDLTINGDKFKVTAEGGDVDFKGDLNINNTFKVESSNGAATSEFPYDDYELNASSSNISATEINGEVVEFASTTNKVLTTQEYVDRELFKQTIRINTMLG